MRPTFGCGRWLWRRAGVAFGPGTLRVRAASRGCRIRAFSGVRAKHWSAGSQPTRPPDGSEGTVSSSANQLAPDRCRPVAGMRIDPRDHSDPVHARLSQLNAVANDVGMAVTTLCADVRDLALDDIPAVFIDPARRSSERRFTAGASEPSLAWCFSLAERGIGVGVKAAPGLPTDVVPAGWELEFVSEHRELKESALWSPSLASTARRATLLPRGETLVDRADARLGVDVPGRYLVDPDPAVTRAGLVKELGESLGACWQIDETIAFLSANEDLRSPFGRTLAVESSEPWSLARLKEVLRALDVGVADIRKRGSAVDVDELQRRLKLSGSRTATVVLTRASGKPWMLVCFEPTESGHPK